MAAAGISILLSVVGCGTRKPSAAPSAAPTKTIDSAATGTITGKVILQGTPPVERPIDMSAEPACQKINPNLASPQVVAGDGGTLANVVVYVKDFPADYVVAPPQGTATLIQRGCMYDPHIVALRAGQPLDIRNEDQATHNLLAMSQANPKFNRSELPGTAPIEEVFNVPELAIPLRCNVHPWMKSYVFVFAHPYFAITTKDGRFELQGLPPGTYTIEAWQELYGAQDQTVTIGAKDSKTADFAFSASK